MDDFDDYKAPSHKQGSAIYNIPQTQKLVEAGGKCYPIYLGGSALQDGQTMSSLQPRSCTKLRCINCDKRVLRYVNNKWKASVDYLFVRNHNTNPKELVKVRLLVFNKKQGTEAAVGYACYACQCKFVSLNEQTS